jgi:hypothetical protein
MIGTLVHSIVQKWAIDKRVFGNWKCSVCSKERKEAFFKQCCGKDPVYSEIEVEYGIIKGHIDLVTCEDKRFRVNDFKTTSLKKIEEEKNLVSLKYRIQIYVYTFIFEQLFDVAMDGPALIFIARDNPAVYKEFRFVWNEEIREAIELFLKSQINAYKAARYSLVNKDAKAAYKYRMCESSEHYKSNCKSAFFGDCKLKSICVDQPVPTHLFTYFNKEFACL